jgi:hypothetical protein
VDVLAAHGHSNLVSGRRPLGGVHARRQLLAAGEPESEIGLAPHGLDEDDLRRYSLAVEPDVLGPNADLERPSRRKPVHAQRSSAGRRFIGGLPTKRATKRFSTEPAALIPSGPPRYSHFGVPASAFLVVQTPPPAGVM